MSAARARQLMAAETAEPGTAPRGKSTLGERYHQRSGPVKRKPAICEIFRILREVPDGTDQPVGPGWPSGAQAGQKVLRRTTRGAGQPPFHRAGRGAERIEDPPSSRHALYPLAVKEAAIHADIQPGDPG